MNTTVFLTHYVYNTISMNKMDFLTQDLYVYTINTMNVTVFFHRHLCNIDCLMVSTALLVCFIRTVDALSKKEAIKTCASCGHITNLKQSILETFNTYGFL